jgi:3-dehydroquinate synthase
LSCLAALGFHLSHPAMLNGALFDGLEEFRQHLGGRLTLTMVPQVGRAIDVHEVDRHKMREAIGRVVEFAETREAATAAL